MTTPADVAAATRRVDLIPTCARWPEKMRYRNRRRANAELVRLLLTEPCPQLSTLNTYLCPDPNSVPHWHVGHAMPWDLEASQATA